MNKPFFNRWTLIALALVIGVAALFWRDISAVMFDGFQSVAGAGQDNYTLPDKGLAKARGFYVEYGGDPSKAPAAVESVRLDSNVEGRATVTLRLLRVGEAAGASAPADYPTLVVEFYSAGGALLRRLGLAPEQYLHGVVLRDEWVRLSFSSQPTETKFKVLARQIAVRPMSEG